MAQILIRIKWKGLLPKIFTHTHYSWSHETERARQPIITVNLLYLAGNWFTICRGAVLWCYVEWVSFV